MRYLRRTYSFLSDKPDEAIERQADRYFAALGYRRQNVPDPCLVYARGRPFRSLVAATLAGCHARVRVERAEGRLSVRHKVEVLGRLLAGADEAILDAEARGFEGYLEGEGVAWNTALLERAYRRARREKGLRALYLVGYTAAIAAVVWWWRGR